jgi:hypothetical protein
VRTRLQRIKDLLDCDVIDRDEASRLLNIPLLDSETTPWLQDVTRWSRSKVGQVWRVKDPFVLNVQGNGNALVVNHGFAAWSVNGVPHSMDRGDLLLVVEDRVGTLAQRLLHLDTGLTFTASGWQSYAELDGSSAP